MSRKGDSDTIYMWSDSQSDYPARRSSPKILAAIALCYLCFCGGNLLGFTSSAIPSMRGLASTEMDNEQFKSMSLDKNLKNSSSQMSSSILPTSRGWLSFEFNSVEEFQNLSDTQASWISGLLPLGAFVGSLVTPLPLSHIGPRGSTLFVASPIFVLSWMIISFAPLVRIVYIGRFLGGLAVGIATSVAPVYIMDTAPIHLRGALGTLPQCFFVAGILTSFLLGSIFNWRECALVCGTFVIPGIFFLILTPESPKWLLTKRKKVLEARSAYFRLNGHSLTAQIEFDELRKNCLYSSDELKTLDCNVDPTTSIMDVNQNQPTQKIQVDLEQQQITGKGKEEAETIGNSLKNFMENLSQPGTLKSTMVVLGLMIAQQLTGINCVNFYTVTIFREALGRQAVLSGQVTMDSIIVATTLNIATFSSIILIEKVGRKLLLLISITLMGLGAFLIGTFFYMKMSHVDSVSSLSWLPLVSLIIFVMAFAVGWGPVCWIIGAEILDNKIRNMINPLCVAVNWLAVFVVAKTFPDLVNSAISIHGAFWLYGGFAILIFLFTWIFVPETKGRSNEDIKKFFNS